MGQCVEDHPKNRVANGINFQNKVVFRGKKKSSGIKDWLEEFWQTVNTAAGNQHLQFTAEIWRKEENSPPPAKEDRVQIVMNNKFPFLYMKMSWSPEGDLQFGVFR